MAEGLKIGIDCDDVLYQTAEASLRFFNERYGNRLELADMFQPPTLAAYGTTDTALIMERVDEFTLEMAGELPMMPGAKEAVERLTDRGNQLYVVTGRSQRTRALTEAVIERDFPGQFQGVEMTDTLDTELRRSKIAVCRDIGARVLCDDQCIADVEEWLDMQVVFGDYPWNRHSKLGTDMVRCVDWLATVKEIERLAT